MLKQLKNHKNVLDPRKDYNGNPGGKVQSIIAISMLATWIILLLVGNSCQNMQTLSMFIATIVGYYFGIESSREFK